MRLSENSTRVLITSVLADRFPMSLRQLHKEVHTQKAISYQGVHKALKELIASGVVDKIERLYSLNKNWVKAQTQMFTNAYANYFNVLYNPNKIDPKAKIQVVRLKTANEMVEFLKRYYREHCSGRPTPIYISIRRMGPFVPHAMIQFVKQVLKKDEIFIICRGDSAADRWVGRFLRLLGVRVKTGVKTISYNSLCVGDTVLQYFFFFDERFRKRLHSFSENFKHKSSASMMKTTADILYRRTEIYIIVNRHPVMADYVKQTVATEFDL